MAEASESEVLEAIGRFIFQFSQLEYTIRVALASALKLPNGPIFHAVTASYDFRTLCQVTTVVLQEQPDISQEQRKAIEALLNECKSLNDERVKIAHGVWMPTLQGGMSTWHVSRQRLKPNEYFSDIKELRRLTSTGEELMRRIVPLLRPLQEPTT